MDGFLVTTEVGYSVYLGSIEIADCSSYDEAVAALRSDPRWNGKIARRVSSYMPCQ